MRDHPRVSVIVPVHNRRDLVIQLLDALDGQTYRKFEIIVIDDGSTDGTADAVAARSVAGRPARVLRQERSGAVAARTKGVAASAGRYLAFTDSDCVPEPGWLAAAVTALDDGADLVNGLTTPTRHLRPLERSVWSADEGLYPTCNVFYRREAFDRAGGFDPTAARRLGFRINERARGLGFGEDTLLAWRVIRSGGVARHVPDAVVQHHVFEADLAEAVSRCGMMAAFPALLREVPELRSTLVRHRVLLGPRNRVPVYLAIAGLLLRRRMTVAVAAAWWGWMRLTEPHSVPVSRRRRLAELPVEMLLDVLTAAALVVGSARARTLAL